MVKDVRWGAFVCSFLSFSPFLEERGLSIMVPGLPLFLGGFSLVRERDESMRFAPRWVSFLGTLPFSAWRQCLLQLYYLLIPAPYPSSSFFPSIRLLSDHPR
jgi:hypothetical protein